MGSSSIVHVCPPLLSTLGWSKTWTLSILARGFAVVAASRGKIVDMCECCSFLCVGLGMTERFGGMSRAYLVWKICL